MNASRFWTATNPEILITPGGGGSGGGGGQGKDKGKKGSGGSGGRGGGWTGRGGGGGWGKGGVEEEILGTFISELITIPGDHNSREFDITDIDGTALSAFSFIQMALRDLTKSGGISDNDLCLRFSVNGGSTWLTGSSDYVERWYRHSAHSGQTNSFITIADSVSFKYSSLWIDSLNAITPTVVTSQELDPLPEQLSRRGGMTLTAAAVHDGIQLYITGDGTPIFTGGTIDIVGYK